MMTFEFNPERGLEGFTQSEITLMDDCGKKWWYRYHELLRKKGDFSWALIVGSAFHGALEQMYATRGERWATPSLVYPTGTLLSPAQQEKELYWVHVLPAMCTAYSQYYAHDFETFVVEEIEEKVEVEFQGFVFRGMIDLRFRPIAKDGQWIMDHKTTSRLDTGTTAGWDFRFQFMFYLWLKWKQGKQPLRGYYVNGVKKPELKLKKTESLEEFAERVRADMVFEPQKYFYREKLIMTSHAMQHFEDEVLAPKVERLLMLTGQGGYDPHAAATVAHNMNTSHCQMYNMPCEFLELCRHGKDQLFNYEHREHKHEELEAEAY